MINKPKGVLISIARVVSVLQFETVVKVSLTVFRCFYRNNKFKSATSMFGLSPTDLRSLVLVQTCIRFTSLCFAIIVVWQWPETKGTHKKRQWHLADLKIKQQIFVLIPKLYKYTTVMWKRRISHLLYLLLCNRTIMS